MLPVISIIGRPNVGKSTLFNRLVGKRVAIVDNTPGVTRDRKEAKTELGDLNFKLIDTAGLEEVRKQNLQMKMMQQTEKAVEDSDLILLVLDGQAGVMPHDVYFANWIRKQKKPVLLLINKCEGKGVLANAAEAYELGLGDPIMISAEHGEGIGLLYEAIKEHLNSPENAGETKDSAAESPDEEELCVAIVGRPNVGKSTLLNRLLGEERSITGEMSGITRDSIETEMEYKGRKIKVIDTAGIRKRSKIIDKIEKMSVSESMKQVDFAHVVILLLDSTLGLEAQDLKIASAVIEEGRCLIIAANKWDIVDDSGSTTESIEYRLEKSLPQAKGIPVVKISALKGANLDKLMGCVLTVYDEWNTRISTGQINKWLEYMEENHTPPMIKNKRVKLRYMTQVGIRPPRFALFTNMVKDFPESYLRYLVNGLRKDFDLYGTPIRIFPRKSENPYNKGKRK